MSEGLSLHKSLYHVKSTDWLIARDHMAGSANDELCEITDAAIVTRKINNILLLIKSSGCVS